MDTIKRVDTHLVFAHGERIWMWPKTSYMELTSENLEAEHKYLHGPESISKLRAIDHEENDLSIPTL